MLSGGAARLISIDILRKEQEEICEREKRNQPLEEASRNAETIFRDKSERKHHLESERAELSKKAGEKAEKEEKYAQWGKGKTLLQRSTSTSELCQGFAVMELTGPMVLSRSGTAG